MFIPPSCEARAGRLRFYPNSCEVSGASVMSSLAGPGSAVPCSSPAGWQSGVVGAGAPQRAPSCQAFDHLHRREGGSMSAAHTASSFLWGSCQKPLRTEGWVWACLWRSLLVSRSESEGTWRLDQRRRARAWKDGEGGGGSRTRPSWRREFTLARFMLFPSYERRNVLPTSKRPSGRWAPTAQLPSPSAPQLHCFLPWAFGQPFRDPEGSLLPRLCDPHLHYFWGPWLDGRASGAPHGEPLLRPPDGRPAEECSLASHTRFLWAAGLMQPVKHLPIRLAA